MIYLDNHSTTAVDPVVFDAMKPYFIEKYGNASHGIHRFNWEAEAAVENARSQIAKLISAQEKEITFTSGATESNHLAILGSVAAMKQSGRTRIISSLIEHSSVLGPLEQLQKQGFKIEWVKLNKDGRVDLGDLQQKIGSDVGLVSIAFANHEIGTIQDVAEISKIVKNAGAIFHTDAVQAFGKLPINVQTHGIDLMTVSAHKIHGPKGIGALYVRRKNPHVEIEKQFWGGNQERGMRSGTPNTPAIVGFGKASEIAGATMNQSSVEMKKMRELLWALLKAELNGLRRNGCIESALPNNLSVSVEGVDGAALFGRLKGVAVSNASACVSGVQDYSQVLSVLGISPNLAKATLRFGLSRFNTLDEMKIAAKEVIFVVKSLRQLESDFAAQTGGKK